MRCTRRSAGSATIAARPGPQHKRSKESLWLAHYVILSRPRRLANLLSHGLPDRAVLEGGPPASISDAFQRLFAEKILETNLACQAARRKLNWPQKGICF